MNKKIILPIFFLVLISLSVLTFALEQSTIPTVPQGSPYEQDTSGVREQQVKIANVLFVIAPIISLLVGIFLTIFMIKNSSRIPHLIIHGLVFLGSSIWFISMIFGLLSQFVNLKHIADTDIITMGWPALLLLVLSGYITYSLIKKKDFEKRMKYTLSLSSGGIIASVLAIIFVIIIGFIFAGVTDIGLGAVLIILFVIFPVGVIGSFILGIIGFFIDKSRKKSNK